MAHVQHEGPWSFDFHEDTPWWDNDTEHPISDLKGPTLEQLRSPMIKVVIGSEEKYDCKSSGNDTDIKDGTSTDLPTNVFYLNKAFLVEHSTLCAILLDTTPDRNVIYLRNCDLKVVETWLRILLAGKIEHYEFSNDDMPFLGQLFDFSDYMGSSLFHNELIDGIHYGDPHVYTLKYLNDLKQYSGAGMNLFKEYVMDNIAWRILKLGWVGFLQAGSLDTGNDENSIPESGIDVAMLEKIKTKVNELTEAQKIRYVYPPGIGTWAGCKYHLHTDKDRKHCFTYGGTKLHEILLSQWERGLEHRAQHGITSRLDYEANLRFNPALKHNDEDW